MIWALLFGVLFYGGSGTEPGILTPQGVKNLEERIEAVVDDAERAGKADALVEEIDAYIKAYNKDFRGYGKDLQRLYKDHSAGPDQMLAVAEELNTEWRAAQDATLGAHFKLRDTMTEEEWLAVYALPETRD